MWRDFMIKNYLKIAFRNFLKNKAFSIINILGLAIGITVCLLITLFIIHELSYDKFNHDYENLYRVVIKGELAGQPIDYAVSMAPLVTVLKNDYPEIEGVTAVFGGATRAMKYEDKQFFEDHINYVTGDFFKVFDYTLIRGEKECVLSELQSIVLTESLAKKYFGDADPMGKTLSVDDTEILTVTGICEDFPTNSHLRMDAVIQIPETEDIAQYWGSFSAHTYVRLNKGADATSFEQKINNLAMEKMGITLETSGMSFLLFLESVTNIHLYSTLSYNLGNDGDITYVYVFSIIALFILIIAYINFINLTTAHYAIRAKEVGIRKIIGASKIKLITQFLIESITITVLAVLVSLALIEITLPLFNKIIGIDLTFSLAALWKLLTAGLIFMIIMALVSGLYPAMHLSALKPISIIRGKLVGGYKKSILRNALVIFQFIISIALISCTGIIYKQLQHFQSKKLGFDKEHVVIIPLRGDRVVSEAPVLKEKLQDFTGIVNTSISSNFPGSGASQGHGFFPEGFNEEKPWLMKTMGIDADFIETFGLKLKEGRNFSADNENEGMNMIVNETLVNEMGWDDPIGKSFKDPFKTDNEVMNPVRIIGVVEDFHVNPLRDKVEPMILNYEPQYSTFLSIRLEPGNVFAALDIIEKEWKVMFPNMPFDYRFLDEHFNEIHKQERNLATTFMYFTFLAIVIACLGLFGLASYATDRRIKEIGVRKVLGSSVGQILLLLSKDFSKLVLLANIVAWPIAWYAMNKWLQNFAYHTQITIWIFIISGIIALIIALLTVSFRTIKAANSNPVKALKYE